MKQHEIDRLSGFLDGQGIHLDGVQKNQLTSYHSFAVSWSQKINLVSAGDVPHLVGRHFLASFYFVKMLIDMKVNPGHRILDLGTGAGFPGVVLSIYFPNNRIILLDSSRKKTIFLRHLKRELKIQADVLCERAETLHEQYSCGFDFLTARAVAPLHRLISLGFPLLKTKGRLLTEKGANYGEELHKNDELYMNLSLDSIDKAWSNYSSHLKEKVFIKMEKKHVRAKAI